MMKLMKRMLVIILACSIFVGGVSNYEMIKAKNNIEGEMLIKSLVTSIKNQDWDTYKMLMSADQKEFYEDYFSDEKNTDGIKQILNIDLDDIIELNKDEVSDELLYDEYPSLKKATSLESFLISVNCI